VRAKNNERQSLGQARSNVNQAKKLIASTIVQVGGASVTRVERTSQRALRAVMEALHTADVILENECHSAVTRTQKAAL